eukprot:2560862-Pyramimonas_sp.AAC.2
MSLAAHAFVAGSCLRQGERQPSASRSRHASGYRRAAVVVASSREDLMRRVTEKARQAEKGWEPSSATGKPLSPTQLRIMSRVEHHVENQQTDWGPALERRAQLERKITLERIYNGPSALEKWLTYVKCVVSGASKCELYV